MASWDLEKWSLNVVHVFLVASLSYHFMISLSKILALVILMIPMPMSWSGVMGSPDAPDMLAKLLMQILVGVCYCSNGGFFCCKCLGCDIAVYIKHIF